MKDMFVHSVFFGALISIAAYEAGVFLQKKTKWQLCNPLLIGIVLIIAVLAVTGIGYDAYEQGAKYISYFLTPATICLAVPLYEQTELLKKNLLAVLAGIVSGVLTSALSILVLSLLFGFSHEQYVTLLPKSITTAIGMGVSEELGGIVTITVAVIVITGVFGNMIAKSVCRWFKICEPIAKGVGIGTASHAVGTAKALEIGQTEGAMSSLSISVAGLLTVLFASVFANFM